MTNKPSHDTCVEVVERLVMKLVTTFYENPTIFLSEGDVQCYLYALLVNDLYFRNSRPEYPTAKRESKTLLVHSDAGVILEGKRKNCDILIFEPNNRDLEPFVAIEIKYNRRRPAGKAKSNIIEDIKKVSATNQGYILWLNWETGIEEDQLKQVKDLIQMHENVKLFYLDMFSDPIKTNIKDILEMGNWLSDEK